MDVPVDILVQSPAVLAAAVAAVLALVGGIAFALRRRAAPAEAEGDGGGPRPPTGGFFAGFARTREALAARLAGLGDKGADAAFEQLEEALISADVGVKTATAVVEGVRRRASRGADGAALRAALKAELAARLGAPVPIAGPPPAAPLVILVVGVNGSGKTTTIGKLAARYVRGGKKVLLAAGDTFRAGAIEQLQIWGERAGAQVVAHQEGADPAAVIFDALEAGKARGVDVVICDTAGRLQAQSTLMDQLSKVVRVMKKAVPRGPDEVLLVLDGTSGQNAMSQARIFKAVVGVTGVALTKLDGTAKGGVVVAIKDELGLDVKLVGLGEGVDDLRDFEPAAFVEALVG
jgi:fused signal recognition particle receptor